MSIFRYIKKTPKSEEIDLLVKLKYGKPNHTNEYLDSLPDSVVDAAYSLLEPNGMPLKSIHLRKQVIYILLQQSTNKLRAEEAIHESLVVYHSLLGTL